MTHTYAPQTVLSRLPGDLISAVELALLLKCAPRTLRTLHRRGLIPAYRLGRHLRFDYRATLEALQDIPPGVNAPKRPVETAIAR